MKNTMKRLPLNLQLFAKPGMKNLDDVAKTELELKEEIKNAIESGDSEAFAKVQVEMAKGIETRILQEAKSAKNENINDNAVMIKRGLTPLTVEEKTYYNEVIGAGGFAGTEKLMPATVFDRVFEDLKANHPLLGQIDFVNTTATTEWITRNNDVAAAWWGSLTSAITKKLEMAFKKETTDLYKLSAFVPVAKAMLDLGPTWLDRFVREILSESMAIALELAIVAGTGKEQPIGMMKDLAGAVVEGVYPDKAPVVFADLSIATIGEKIMLPLSDNGKKVVNLAEVRFIVNPIDYWTKILPQKEYKAKDGAYYTRSLLIDLDKNFVQSTAVPAGKMVAGFLKNYFLGVGSTQKVEFSDHYKFLEDERTYITKQYANGHPKDNTSFILLDIADMVIPTV